jgi:hypothetical protein
MTAMIAPKGIELSSKGGNVAYSPVPETIYSYSTIMALTRNPLHTYMVIITCNRTLSCFPAVI